MLKKQEQAEITLKIAHEGMQEALQGEEIFRMSTGAGHLHFLVKSLAKDFLTKEQYRRVEEIMKMHSACLYGKDIVYGTKETE